MLKGFENKRIKLNAPLRGFKEGQEINIKTDGKGIPLDPYWRRRFNDAKEDKCLEVIENKPTSK